MLLATHQEPIAGAKTIASIADVGTLGHQGAAISSSRQGRAAEASIAVCAAALYFLAGGPNSVTAHRHDEQAGETSDARVMGRGCSKLSSLCHLYSRVGGSLGVHIPPQSLFYGLFTCLALPSCLKKQL